MPVAELSLARRGLTLVLLCAAALAAHAATLGSGTPASETRPVSGFTSIALRGDIDLVVRQAASEAVRVRTDDNLLTLLQTSVETSGAARTLVIQWARGQNVRAKSRSVVEIDVVDLGAVSASGSGDIRVESLKTPALAVQLHGSSDARLAQLDTRQLRVSIAGSGDVQAAGRADRLSVSIAGSGDVRTRELAADDVSVSIAGSGDASVQANKSITVSIAGSGDVDYGGAATLTRSSIAGSGSVRQRP
jgi:Putative auto-transporter adhesin, head GIN domain